MSSLRPHLESKPADFDDIVSLIVKSHEEPTNSELQEHVLKACLNYLKENGEDTHWFCDEYLYPISIHTLVLFSFPNNSLVDWITPLMANCLVRCNACVARFVEGKHLLFQEFAIERRIPMAHVKQVIDSIDAWQITLMHGCLEEMAAKISKKEHVDRDSVHSQVERILLDPDLMKHNPEIKQNAILLVKYCIESHLEIRLQSLPPGAIYFMFSEDPQLVDWARKVAQTLTGKLTVESPYTSVATEFSIYLYQIQNEKYYNDDLCAQFWENCYYIMSAIDKEVFIEHMNSPKSIAVMSEVDNVSYFSLVRVLLNHLRAHINKPLQSAINIFQLLLKDYGTMFWTYASPFAFANVLDFIFSNRNYFDLCMHSDNFSALTKWQTVFLHSIFESSKSPSIVRMSNFLFSLNAQSSSKTEIASETIDILLSSFDEHSFDLKNKNLDVYILSRRDVRAIIDVHAAAMVFWLDTIQAPHIIRKLTTLIKLTFLYDSSILAFNSLQLQNGTKPKVFDAFPLLWQELAKQKTYSKDLVSCLIESFVFLGSTVLFIPRKSSTAETELADPRKRHNTQVKLVTEPVREIVERISTLDNIPFDELFYKTTYADGFWSCLFSSLVSQQTLDIVYQTYDVVGRYEGLQKLLKSHLNSSFRSLNLGLKNVTRLAAFEPSPRAMRLTMDIVKAFMDPIDGIAMEVLTAQEEVEEFWSVAWAFLSMVYKKALIWASMYHLSDLVEFTRDTLDLSHLLLDSFRLFVDYIGNDGGRTSSKLLKVFIDAFYFVIVWLRLGDVSLLNSCVDLVFKGFDLAHSYKVAVDPQFITLFVKYGAKAKKFNNMLTPKQRADIISKAREFDSALVDNILTEVRTSTPPVENKETNKNRAELKQQTLTKFGVTTSTPPVAPPPVQKEFRSSALETLRKELKERRAPPKPLSSAPAQARPAGFNRKPVAVGRSLNQLRKRSADSESSDDDNESEVDTSDLFIEKKKKPKVIEVDIHGRPIAKSLQTTVNKERQEQERMRLRLNVSMNGLYQKILKWNYNSTKSVPDAASEPTRTKDTYENTRDYVNTVEPLLMLECWESLQQSKTAGDDMPFELFVGRRLSCDGFFELNCTISKAVLSTIKLGDSDLIVLTHVEKDNMMNKYQLRDHIIKLDTLTCLAKIVSVKYANSESADVTLRVSPQGGMLGFLTPKSVLFGMKVMQMITAEREYSSLKGLQYYDLCDEILQAESSETMKSSMPQQTVDNIMKLYKANNSQAVAIATTANAQGFSLIQGPPGTGKTKTILGILGYNLKAQKEAGKVNKSAEIRANEESRILVCAPSNAAVDELVLRIREGVINSNGETIIPKVVRLGRSDTANASVRDLTLEELVENQIGEKAQQGGIDPTLREEQSRLTQKRNQLNEQRRDPNITGKQLEIIENELREINKKRHALSQQLDQEREKASIAYRTREIEKRQVQQKVLTEAQVICSTLSASAHDFLSSMSMTFRKVIIDEACQCVELSALIPLRYGCKQCIMVGDPNQLPPTVLSTINQSTNYEQSLFVRIQKQNPDSVHLLDVQYRMHPEISQFPSQEFYQGKLKDGSGMELQTTRPWHSYYPLTPYRVFDIASRHTQSNKTMSFFNTTEARVAMEIVTQVRSFIPIEEFRGKIGLISPYKEQVRTLRDLFVKKYGSGILKEIDFNTVDGYQGQEKEIIIMSCVRASDNGGVGFLGDIRRMNVGLTRAKTSLWVLGNVESLSRNKRWNHLLNNARNRDLIVKAYPGFLNTTGRQLSVPYKPQLQAPVEVTIDRPSDQQTPPTDYDSAQSTSKAVPPGPESDPSDSYSAAKQVESTTQPQPVSQQAPAKEQPTHVASKPAPPKLPPKPAVAKSDTKHGISNNKPSRGGPKKKKPKVYVYNDSSKKSHHNSSSQNNLPEQQQPQQQQPQQQHPEQQQPQQAQQPGQKSKPVVTKSGTLPPRWKKNSSIFINRKKPTY